MSSNISYFEKAKSSSDLLHESYDENSHEYTSILVNEQTNGRGRFGRKWISTKGNLHFSTLVKPTLNIKYWPQLSFVTSLAVRSTLCHYIKNIYKISFKWPNDIFLENKKISGILIETTNDHKALVVGVGINLISNPLQVNSNWESTNLYNYSKVKISTKDISVLLLEEIQNYIKIWYDNGFSYIKKLWIKNVLFLNYDLYSTDLNKTYRGKFVDIGEFGQIILKDKESNLIKLSSGTFLPSQLMD